MLAEGTLVVSKRYVTMVLSPDDRGDRGFVNLRTGGVGHYSKFFAADEDLQMFYNINEVDLKEVL